MSFTDRMKALNSQLADIRKEMVKTAQTALKDECKLLFEKYPEMEEFSWTQYTPYFNDGDECVFSVHSDYPNINGDEVGYKDTTWLGQAEKDVVALLQAIDEETMKTIFGDHVKVVVTKEGITAENYSHD